MEIIDILREASKKVYENVRYLAGTSEAAGDYGRGAGPIGRFELAGEAGCIG